MLAVLPVSSANHAANRAGSRENHRFPLPAVVFAAAATPAGCEE